MKKHSWFRVEVLLVCLTLVAAAAISHAQTCTVNWNNVHQRIDGFGASSAWRGSWTTAQADMFFSTNNGIGLSLLRNHITYAGSASSSATPTTVEISIMTNAQARGALVWSAPWTPAAGFKSTNDIYDSNKATGNGINGGSFRGGTTTNLAYASQLANYVASMKPIMASISTPFPSKTSRTRASPATRPVSGPRPTFMISSPTFTMRWRPKESVQPRSCFRKARIGRIQSGLASTALSDANVAART